MTLPESEVILFHLRRMKEALEKHKNAFSTIPEENDEFIPLPDLLSNCKLRSIPDQSPIVLTSRVSNLSLKQKKLTNRNAEPITCEEGGPLIYRLGSIRGVRYGVSKTIQSFSLQKQWKHNYKSQDRGKIVVYITSMGVVRKTWEKCRKAVMILEQNHIKFERRDLFIGKSYVDEFRNRTGTKEIQLPKIYVDGEVIGDDSKLEIWNENGLLKRILKPYISTVPCQICIQCYGFKFLPCTKCHGGKKSKFRYAEMRFRCAYCDDSGLVICEKCSTCIIC